MSQILDIQAKDDNTVSRAPIPCVSPDDGLPYGTFACGRRGEIYNDGLCERCHETDEEERRERFDAENDGEKWDGMA